ncbi:MAG: ribonuclease T2 family protein [Rhodoblastus sp.]
MIAPFRRAPVLRRALPAVAGVFFLMQAAPALAQRSDCILDNCADKRAPERSFDRGRRDESRNDGYDRYRDRPGPRGASRSGDFDFYVLSLSWSSGFCATGGAEKGKAQCERGANLGFVVHGLWPQYERGFPQDCGGGPVSSVALDQARGLFPDLGLARYEWRKHGTCSGKSPAEYFADVRRARDMIEIPNEFSKVARDRSTSPQDILRSFENSNRRLRPGMAAVGCRSGVLQEVRFCLTRDLRDFRPCPEVARSSCRTREIDVPGPL